MVFSDTAETEVSCRRKSVRIQSNAIGSERYGFMSPFQGLKDVFGAFTQGVALGCIILPFQGYKRLRTIFIARS